MANNKLKVDGGYLKHLYLNKNLSTYKIGKILNCSASTITNRLLEFKIPIKNPAFARMKYEKSDFSGSDTDKAYMIGFRVGDLNVYQKSKNSETIVVRCHTTQREQVDVINALFSKFGRVDDIMRLNGHYYTNCFLNNSFKFLFPKDKSAWSWIQKPKTRFAFIAGYTDAEGNFIINQSRARFKIDSYDKDVLDTIAKWLNEAEISYKMRLIFKKGDRQKIYDKIGIYHNDLWRLNINHAKDLEKFILLIGPFVKHSKRIKDMKLCSENIKNRIKNGSIK
ncbi:MAG: hypothetical protein A3J46_05860 [Candidatus Yanofskybacteria bacterium RIFCSPHIGHO2_02_FULL_41_11]|uniref:Homing endonuclease LAGLIDADG domain-containing protein n=1 Tax=Candidatus Yanofskybacteria bacterium RIFCSPHIGHO2_02_FULL_41_11 TaxID=1802675 RepID=A0A1F8F839_9BACT|nr:MAG: hypothetical protein A3J46_05860 [Candidatus Yanofskybacteria bacterium RIFCSPHIGHO2_02_FULL_41_11]